MKNIYIESLPTEMSSGRHIIDTNKGNSKMVELAQIFLDETPTEDFPGFELSLERIFLNETIDDEFLGFDRSLNQIFNEDSDSENEFFGFN